MYYGKDFGKAPQVIRKRSAAVCCWTEANPAAEATTFRKCTFGMILLPVRGEIPQWMQNSKALSSSKVYICIYIHTCIYMHGSDWGPVTDPSMEHHRTRMTKLLDPASRLLAIVKRPVGTLSFVGRPAVTFEG